MVKRFTTLPTEPFRLYLLKFATVRSRGGLKRKIIRMILSVSNFKGASLSIEFDYSSKKPKIVKKLSAHVQKVHFYHNKP